MDKKTKYLTILILLPLILKLILAFVIPGHMAIEGFEEYREYGDIDTLKRISDTMIEGKNLYEVEGMGHLLVYGPIAYLFYMFCGITAIKTGLPFYFVIKILPILAMVLSYYFFTSKNKKIRNILPAVCLGLGASFKFYPIYLMPVLFFKYETIREKLSSVLIAVFSFLITYIGLIISGHFFTAIRGTFDYTPVFNWGVAKFFLLFNQFSIASPQISLVENLLISYGKFLLGVALITTVLVCRKKPLGTSYKMLFYCIYVFSFFIHVHYLTWIIPFLFLEINFREILYIVPVTGHIYFLYMIQLIGMGLGFGIGDNILFSALSFIFGVLTWLFCIYIYFSHIKRESQKNGA